MEIIFDLGGVLVSETSQVRDAAEALGLAPHQVHGPYWKQRDAWDRGGSDHDYWQAVAGSIPVNERAVEHLSAHDVALWTQLRPQARAILEELSATDHRVWLLSNAAARFTEAVGHSDWRFFLDGVFISGALGVMKPDPGIYQVVEQEVGTDPSAFHFIDDRPRNLEAAAARGWQTHLFVDDADTHAWLVGIGALQD